MIGTSIPIIDLAPYTDSSPNTKHTAQAIRQACKNVGFFYVKNHGVPDELIKSIFANSVKFFSLSRQEKKQIRMEFAEQAWRGYYQIGEERTNGKIDYQEGVYLGRQQDEKDPRVINKVTLHGQNLYPKQVPELKRDIQEWLQQMNRLGGLLMQAFAESLGLKRTFFSESLCKDHFALMVLLHYPQIPEQHRKQAQPLGQHCDYGFITILMGTEKGLQAKNVDNEWINIDPIPGHFVINIADMLQKATKGFYKSTPHRVVNSGKERYSIPYHYDPGYDQKVFQLDFEVSEEDKRIIEKTRVYKRMDEANIQQLNRTIGQHYISKHFVTFPDLAQRFLKPK